MSRILVVEDDTAQRFLVDVILKRKDYEMVGVGRADDALELLDTDDCFDVILADYRLPGMDGVDFVRELQRDYADIPVVVMSVQSGHQWTDEAYAAGAAAALIKPFFGPELIATLEAVLRKQPDPCSPSP